MKRITTTQIKIKTLEELKQFDIGNAYLGYMTVAEACEYGKFDSYYKDIFKTHCKCGAERIINGDLTDLTCCDPYCYLKQGYQLSKIYSRFSCQDIAENTCIDIAEYFKDSGIRSAVELLNKEDGGLKLKIGSHRYSKYKQAFDKITKSHLTFSEYCSKMGIPYFEKTIKNVLRNFSNVNELLDYLVKVDLTSFMHSCGVYDCKKISSFFFHLDDIFYISYYFNEFMEAPALHEITVCMTGYPNFKNGFITSKGKFIDYMNETSVAYDGTPLFRFNRTDGVKTAPFVLADEPSTHYKFVEGYRRQRELDERRQYMDEEVSNDTHDILMTTNDFYDYIQSLIKEYNIQRQEYLKTISEDSRETKRMEVY